MFVSHLVPKRIYHGGEENTPRLWQLSPQSTWVKRKNPTLHLDLGFQDFILTILQDCEQKFKET